MTNATKPLVGRGLYDPRFEHDACGIGFVARLSGVVSHDILSMALTAVGNMAHRGGVGADGKSGDGAGILTQIPRDFFARELSRAGIAHPVEDLAVAMVFLPADEAGAATARTIFAEVLEQFGLMLLGWRVVPVDKNHLGDKAYVTCPTIEQALIGRRGIEVSASSIVGEELHARTPLAYERLLFLARKQIESKAREQALVDFSIPSMSSRTIVYKGLLVAPLLAEFYSDLRDPEFKTAIAVYHQRYSTNTSPTWGLAQPFRMLSHNGEINTVEGNATWMNAREAEWRAAIQGIENDVICPAVQHGGTALADALAKTGTLLNKHGSDSSKLDNVLELLVLAGRDVRHSLTMLVPEAWEQVPDMDASWRAFYQYHATLMEPWDGPAALVFCDGDTAGLALDRNGLRPARFLLTDDGLLVCGSEVGAVEIEESRILRKGKVGPGQMIAVDLTTGQFQENQEIKSFLAARQPYAEWLAEELQVLSPAGAAFISDEAETESAASRESKSALLGELQRAFGYTSEETVVVLRPMLREGYEPLGSMGDDTGPAIFAERSRPLFGFFKQRFAEVTNPPIDPIREELVMSLSFSLGRRGHLLAETPKHAHLLRLASPVLSDEHIQTLRAHNDPAFASQTLSSLFPASEGPAGMLAALDRLRQEAEQAIANDKVILIISDRGVNPEMVPIPSLLALGAVHHHLLRLGLRTSVSLVVESGEPREVHHLACLVGMGAEAVNPYLALASVRALSLERERVSKNSPVVEETRTPEEITQEAEHNYIHALEKGLLKVMSKMGIATIDSYCAAQIFEAIGLDQEVIDSCFTGVPSRLGGIGFAELAQASIGHHDEAFANRLPMVANRSSLPHPGFYKFKKDGEYHTYTPAVVHALQKAAKGGSYEDYVSYSKLVHSRPPAELRDLLEFALSRDDVSPISIDEVESAESIAMRFSTAAMSLGATSSESHEGISIAMNRLGALSNSGEGGEDPERYGDERNSTIKQVASARFGVTPGYLMSGKELQIKMAQGSKPGEGGQLPAFKVSEEIARIRYTTPGVQLISPPPHHDIYSIEDLAQLIYDLRQINPTAAVSVKLVAEAGVGTVAAGVAKGGADVILISGHSGGTGASPLSSIKNAGVNLELGLAEAQQTLVLNDLRGRVRLRADGGLKTGRDVVMMALLGADEYSFGTAALVAQGCIMARNCHSNNCPVGIATQRADLRAKFDGTPEQIIHFFLHIAEEVREILAQLGARTIAEVVGRTELLEQVQRNFAAADRINMAPLLERLDEEGVPIRNVQPESGMIGVGELNQRILNDALQNAEYAAGQPLSAPIELSYNITNVDRTVGATLTGDLTVRYGHLGMPDGSINLNFTGSAGQSFGAFLNAGMRLRLSGQANDYVGKGMGGGEIIVQLPAGARYASHENTIIGNTVLYGATGGVLYAAGRAGERFAVRNSGGVAVVEGVGDHACEYMTGGLVMVLGATGRNFAAGMSGGLAYVFDETGEFTHRYNGEMVELSRLEAADFENVRALLVRHHELTGSLRASDILNRWDSTRGLFWRVQPKGLEVVKLPPVLAKVREYALS
jgi:glutamate synthase (ferredoxin)